MAVVSVRPDDIGDFCMESSGFADEPFTPVGDRFEPSQQILMLISGRHAGEVEIDGIDLDYSHGNQRGTRQVGQHLVVEVG